MKTVFITGSNRGIGLEFVKQYLNDGYQVISCCRNPETADELQSLKITYPKELDIYRLDVSNFKMIEELSKILKGIPIDIIINNAAVYGSDHNSFLDIDYQDWSNTFTVNCMSAVKISECFIENISCSNEKKMVFLSSQMGSIDDNGSGGCYLYRSTKASLNAVVKSLSIDLRHRNISTLILHPGWVLTDMGGPNAQITTAVSVEGMKKVINNLSVKNSGSFLDFEGMPILW